MPSDFPELGGPELPHLPHEEPIPVGPIVTGPGAPTSTHSDAPPGGLERAGRLPTAAHLGGSPVAGDQ